MKNCPVCGTTLDDTCNFCNKCGANIASGATNTSYQYQQYQPYQPPRTNGLAIAGLICAFVFAPLGLILSILGMNEIKNSNGTQEGHGLALAGLIISIVFLAGYLLVIPMYCAALSCGSFYWY